MSVGGRIKELRVALGMTQAAFASAIGAKTTHSRVSEWEREEVEPEVGTLGLIAAAARPRFDQDAIFLWLQEGGELPSEATVAPKGGVQKGVATYDPRHTTETAVRMQVVSGVLKRLVEAGNSVPLELAASLVSELSDAWARQEAMRSLVSEQWAAKRGG